MDENSIEKSEKEKQRIADLVGVIDYDHFLEFKYNAVLGMYRFGDRFINALSIGLDAADDDDAVKILRIWGNQIAQCEMMQRIAKAKKKALDEQKEMPNCS